MKEKILEYFKDVNLMYNDCTRFDTLKKMLDELEQELIVDGKVYVAKEPRVKTIHDKTGEVVIGGFQEVS